MSLVISKSALVVTIALVAMQSHSSSALPLRSAIIEPQQSATTVACKYGSGKCADVKPEHKAPSTMKNGPQDPTVDPDCGHYGNCRGGNPEGGSASATRGSAPGTNGSLPTSAKSSSGKSK